MNAFQRKQWLARREVVRDSLPYEAVLGAFIASETGYSTGIVANVLAGRTERYGRTQIAERVLAARDELVSVMAAAGWTPATKEDANE